MLNGKQISAYSVIREVYRDSGLTSEVPVQDAVEWAVDCLDLIGCAKAYNREVIMLEVENFKAKLPCNYRQMIHASGANAQGMIFDLTFTGNTFHPTNQVANDNVNLSTQTITNNGLIVDTSDPVGADSQGNPSFNYTNANTLTTLFNGTTETISRSIPVQATYYLNEDYIFTSYEEGYVLISYLAYPFDCQGFPLIPDDIKFRKAVQWYIQERIDYKLWRQDLIADKVYKETSKERDWYMGAAQTGSIMPSLDEMERLKNMFTKILLRADYHKVAFGI